MPTSIGQQLKMKDESSEKVTSAEQPLNYFNYFTEVEDTFIRRRGKHLLLCSLDWNLIEVWKDRGIPLHVVLRGIERWFDFYEAKRRRRSVNMLLYCQEEVEAQYAEWLESRVGAGTTTNGDSSSASKLSDVDEGLPFPRQAIIEHLRHGRSALSQVFEKRNGLSEDDFSDALLRAANLLEELERDFTESELPDAQGLELSLTGLERMLSDAIRSTISVEELAAARSEVKKQLRPYRKQMEKSVYEQTAENLLLKRLREQFSVPRLSLFYL